MKKHFIILCFLIFSNSKFYGQERVNKQVNFIISVDDKVVIGSIAHCHLIIDGVISKTEIGYIPGKLSFISNSEISNKLMAAKYVLLAFNYYEYCNGNQIVHNYEIELKKAWLDYSFVVLRIYNVNKKRYKGMFNPLKNKDYTYEMDFPEGSITRVKKKLLNENCY